MTTISNRYLDPYQSLRARVLALTILVGVGMLLDLAGAGAGLSQAALLSGMAAGRSFPQAEIKANDARVQLVAILTIFVYLATVVAFLAWIHRAHKNLASFGTAGLEYSPGWAIGGFFVPFLNLVRPFQVMREIWKASNPDVDYQNDRSWQYSASSALIGLWWGTWILAGVLGRLVFRLSRGAKTIDSLLSLTYLSIVSDIINLLPAVLVMVLVRAIDRKQQLKHRRLTALWSQQSTPVAQPVSEPIDPGSL